MAVYVDATGLTNAMFAIARITRGMKKVNHVSVPHAASCLMVMICASVMRMVKQLGV